MSVAINAAMHCPKICKGALIYSRTQASPDTSINQSFNHSFNYTFPDTCRWSKSRQGQNGGKQRAASAMTAAYILCLFLLPGHKVPEPLELPFPHPLDSCQVFGSSRSEENAGWAHADHCGCSSWQNVVMQPPQQPPPSQPAQTKKALSKGCSTPSSTVTPVLVLQLEISMPGGFSGLLPGCFSPLQPAGPEPRHECGLVKVFSSSPSSTVTPVFVLQPETNA